MVERRVVPDEQLGHFRPYRTQPFYEGDTIILAALLAHQLMWYDADSCAINLYSERGKFSHERKS